MSSSPSRRQFLTGALGVVAAAAVTATARSSAGAIATTTAPATGPAGAAAQRYRISASDWMLLKRQKQGALQLAKDCGLDGIELDMGPLGKRPDIENKLRDEGFRQQYLDSAKALDLQISSLALSAFYGQPLADHPKAIQFATEWIQLMGKVGTRVGFLPLITKGKRDLVDDPQTRQKVVGLFRTIGAEAEKAEVVLGLSTSLDASPANALLDEIGSPAVRIAYNIGESTDAGRDVYAELRTLGGRRIAEIVPTLSDGHWLQDDKRIDVPRLKQVLDEIGWSGWLVLQRSRVGKNVRENFTANARYLKSIFQSA